MKYVNIVLAALLVPDGTGAQDYACRCVLGNSEPTPSWFVVSGTADLGRELEKLGIVREITGKARGRVFACARYLDVLNADT